MSIANNVSPSVSVNLANLEKELADHKAMEIQIQNRINEEKQAAVELAVINERIQTLPGLFGLGSIKDVLHLIHDHVFGNEAEGEEPRNRYRSKITKSIESEILSMLNDGKTGKQISRKVRLSLPTIYKVKDKYGLVHHRGTSVAA